LPYKSYWFSNPLGVAGLLIGGPIGLAAGATVGAVMAYEFEKKIMEKDNGIC